MGYSKAAALILIGFCLAAGSLQAESPPYSIHDLNQDGYLDRDEYAAFLSHFWAHRAQNGQRLPRRPPLEFQEIDLDHDGLISEREMGQALERRRQHRQWRHWRER